MLMVGSELVAVVWIWHFCCKIVHYSIAILGGHLPWHSVHVPLSGWKWHIMWWRHCCCISRSGMIDILKICPWKPIEWSGCGGSSCGRLISTHNMMVSDRRISRKESEQFLSFVFKYISLHLLHCQDYWWWSFQRI